MEKDVNILKPHPTKSNMAAISFDLDGIQILDHFILLGASKYSNMDLIEDVMEKLIQMMNKTPEMADRVFDKINEINKEKRNYTMDAFFLCLAVCYWKSNNGKIKIREGINKLCRIPTHLFTLVDMLLKFNDWGEESHGKKFYEFLLKHKGSFNGEVTGRKKPKALAQPKKMSTFVPSLKFVQKWYSDPKKTTEDLLLLLTKYSRREKLDHKKLLQYCHVNFGCELKNAVVGYHLHGFKKIEELCNDCEGKKILCQDKDRLCAFVKALEEIKNVTSDDVRCVDKIIDLIEKGRRDREEYFTVPLEGCQLSTSMSSVFEHPITDDDYEDDDEGYVIAGLGDGVEEIKIESRTTGEIYKRSISKIVLTRFHLVLEHISNRYYHEKAVWNALMIDMPLGASLRNVVHMASLGLFEETDGEKNIEIFKNKFLNPECKFPSFIHPFQVLKCLMAYQNGTHKRTKSWDINPNLWEVLKDIYYEACRRNRKFLAFDDCVVCIDCSQLMREEGFLGFPSLNAVKASHALVNAMEKGNATSITTFMCGFKPYMSEKKDLSEILLPHGKAGDSSNPSSPPKQTERKPDICDNQELSILAITNKEIPKQSNLAGVLKHYISTKQNVKSFIVFTKSRKNSFCGGDPYGMFQKYVEEVKEDAKLIICSMEARINTIADPDNPNVQILCGGDADLLPRINDFINA